jgi:hypothetical protein
MTLVAEKILYELEFSLTVFQNSFHVLCSLQATVQHYHQLQREYEEVKEVVVTVESVVIVQKLRVQQLEKEAQANKQQLLELENQVQAQL